MTTPESLQLLDVMRRIFRLNASRFHPAAVNDQEVQDVDRPMPGVLELLLFDRARDRSTDRVAFKDLVVGDLIGADHPIAPLYQAVGVGVAPEDTKNSKTGRPQSKFGRRFRSGPARWPSGWAFCELTASLN